MEKLRIREWKCSYSIVMPLMTRANSDHRVRTGTRRFRQSNAIGVVEHISGGSYAMSRNKTPDPDLHLQHNFAGLMTASGFLVAFILIKMKGLA